MHRRLIKSRGLRFLRRFEPGEDDDYPCRSHGQPFTAWLALIGCLFIVIIANGASLWIRFRPSPFLGAYLAVSIASYCNKIREGIAANFFLNQPIAFLCTWMVMKLMKLMRRDPWRPVDLSQGDVVLRKLEELDRLRWRNTEDQEPLGAWYNLWGLFEKMEARNLAL